MFPEVLRIGDFVITSFGVMLMLSFLVGRYVLAGSSNGTAARRSSRGT